MNCPDSTLPLLPKLQLAIMFQFSCMYRVKFLILINTRLALGKLISVSHFELSLRKQECYAFDQPFGHSIQDLFADLIANSWSPFGAKTVQLLQALWSLEQE